MEHILIQTNAFDIKFICVVCVKVYGFELSLDISTKHTML